MVTWMELLTFCLVVIAVIELTRSERAKKRRSPLVLAGFLRLGSIVRRLPPVQLNTGRKPPTAFHLIQLVIDLYWSMSYIDHGLKHSKLARCIPVASGELVLCGAFPGALPRANRPREIAAPPAPRGRPITRHVTRTPPAVACRITRTAKPARPSGSPPLASPKTFARRNPQARPARLARVFRPLDSRFRPTCINQKAPLRSFSPIWNHRVP